MYLILLLNIVPEHPFWTSRIAIFYTYILKYVYMKYTVDNHLAAGSVLMN